MMDCSRKLHRLAYAACVGSFVVQIWHLAQLPSQRFKVAVVIACSAIICRAFVKRDFNFCPPKLTQFAWALLVLYAMFFAVDLWLKQYHLAFASSLVFVGILLHAEVSVESWHRLRPLGFLLLLAALPTSNQWSWLDQRYHELVLESAKDLELADESNWLLAQIYIVENNEKLATTLLQSIAKPQPEVLLLLSRLYKNGGDHTAFMRSANAAEAACGLAIAQSPNDTSKTRLTLAKVYLLQDRYADALTVLESIPEFSQDAEMRRMGIEIDIASYKSIPSQLVSEKIKRLQHATHLDSSLPVLQELIAAIFVESPIGEQNNLILFCMDYIRASEQNGKLSPSSISMLGIKAAEGKKYKLAEKLFRRSIAAGNPTPILLNNLAWVLLQQSDPKLIDEALTISNQAVAAGPYEAESRKTRADIWLKRGRPLNAILDLEHAIKLGGEDIAVTIKLADLYDQMG